MNDHDHDYDYDELMRYFSKRISFLFYDEKLEAEYILRVRSIFDEFVCPETGTFLMCTFNELTIGVQRLWSIAQEMKGQTEQIHERLIHLPILFIIVLLRFIEREYTVEDHEKSVMDTQLAESILFLFYEFKEKSSRFQTSSVQIIIYNTCVIYLRHLIELIISDNQIKRLKWNELRMDRCIVICPFRKTDIIVLKDALRHFRGNILNQFSKRKVKYNLTFRNKFPEVMEPTRNLQIRIADSIFFMSLILMILAVTLLTITRYPSNDSAI